ncbi:hypothetical protein BFN03_07110 [Rhodococcus sp. WMMA185]|uniref:hypothetical protein n=1 Tax=Rhodococcus sp. WMMA185 TaxID=679318 RepID=UPI0008790F59|nr:hypothetical protein [Rhodococcus sp. WMMA185]AOW92552.1 hypothetical protein BFN03_07110 [Rhodococcus sp. WMMA185]
MTDIDPDSVTPLRTPLPDTGLPWRWPQPLKISWLVYTAFIVGIAAVMVVAVIKAVDDDEPGLVVGFVSLMVMLGLTSIGMLGKSGFRSIGLPSRIIPCDGDRFGKGIQVPKERLEHAILITALLGAATAGLTTALVWYLGIGETLLPFGRETNSGANYMGICGGVALIAALFLLAIRLPTTVSIYPTGVRRRVRQWRGLSFRTYDAFLPWDDIAQISADELVVGGGWSETGRPRIKLKSATPVPVDQQLHFDAENEITLMAYQLVGEPNTLLSLLLFLKDNPDQRGIVAGPDARELLTPPPLRERFRVARLAKKGALDA